MARKGNFPLVVGREEAYRVPSPTVHPCNPVQSSLELLHAHACAMHVMWTSSVSARMRVKGGMEEVWRVFVQLECLLCWVVRGFIRESSIALGPFHGWHAGWWLA